EHHARRAARTGNLTRGARSRSSRDAVVDHHHDATLQPNRRSATAKAPDPNLELGAFASFHFVQLTGGDASDADDLLIDNAHAFLADRTHGEFRLEGYAEFTNNDHVKWRVQRSGNLVGDRHAAPRQAQHHYLVASQVLQSRGKTTSRVGTIDKGHNDPPTHSLASPTTTQGSLVPTSIPGDKQRHGPSDGGAHCDHCVSRPSGPGSWATRALIRSGSAPPESACGASRAHVAGFCDLALLLNSPLDKCGEGVSNRG